MNTFNEELRARAEIAIHLSGERGVRLRGGPMDGWLVKPEAEVLEVDWYMTWSPGVAARFEPGRYDLDPSGKYAIWREWGRRLRSVAPRLVSSSELPDRIRSTGP